MLVALTPNAPDAGSSPAPGWWTGAGRGSTDKAGPYLGVLDDLVPTALQVTDQSGFYSGDVEAVGSAPTFA
ncbi:MAG: hypothetical protein ACJ768_21295 [Gaiellaceae bacterium]